MTCGREGWGRMEGRGEEWSGEFSFSFSLGFWDLRISDFRFQILKFALTDYMISR